MISSVKVAVLTNMKKIINVYHVRSMNYKQIINVQSVGVRLSVVFVKVVHSVKFQSMESVNNALITQL